MHLLRIMLRIIETRIVVVVFKVGYDGIVAAMAMAIVIVMAIILIMMCIQMNNENKITNIVSSWFKLVIWKVTVSIILHIMIHINTIIQ